MSFRCYRLFLMWLKFAAGLKSHWRGCGIRHKQKLFPYASSLRELLRDAAL